MRITLSILLVCAVALAGCKTTDQKQKEKKAALTKKADAKAREADTDLDFQAFVGRLRKAVAGHDVATVKSMMTPNFGYRLEPKMEGVEASAEGPGVFQYWDEQGLWPELQGILSEKFVKYKDYMVAPPQFAEEALNYDGYRAGIRRVNGSWKFAYFVNGP